MTHPAKNIRGRCLALQETPTHLRVEIGTFNGSETIEAPRSAPCSIGDWVSWDGRTLQTLTRNRTSGKLRLRDRILDPRRLHAVRVRNQVEGGIRSFFAGQGFLETRTPLLVASPGMEPHIRPFELKSRREGERSFLPTSPEFAMKKLLSAGLEKIFQISPVFRNEPYSSTHHPEFTMLEWYRAFADLETIMADTERLVETLAIAVFGKPEIRFDGKSIDVRAPWPRLRIRDLFRTHLGIDVGTADAGALAERCLSVGVQASAQEPWDDLYFKLWLNAIEPKLPEDRAVIVHGYPASQAALSVVETDPRDGTRWAKRFEAYAAGFELGNAFEELTDPVEQRARFVEDMKLRKAIYGESFPESPIDEEFLLALEEGLPPSGGIAVGVDRLVMLFSGEREIERTQWLPAHSPDFQAAD